MPEAIADILFRLLARTSPQTFEHRLIPLFAFSEAIRDLSRRDQQFGKHIADYDLE